MTSALKYVRDKDLAHKDEYSYKSIKKVFKWDSETFKI